MLFSLYFAKDCFVLEKPKDEEGKRPKEGKGKGTSEGEGEPEEGEGGSKILHSAQKDRPMPQGRRPPSGK